MNIIIAGDFAPKDRLLKQVHLGKYSDIFPDELVRIVRSADYSIVNLECPIVDSTFSKITKCGPNLGCSKDIVEAISFVGFRGVTLANNHILDFGKEGVNNTIKQINTFGINTVGAGESFTDAEKILYITNKKIIAIINCCEHEFSIATHNSAGANPLNPIRQYYIIQEARKKADYVIVIVHGGHEHYNLPSPRMKECYRFFVDSGADAVINHHQHCYSGYEIYNDKPIFYGLGNFCFDWDGIRDKKWSNGYLLELNLNDIISFKIYPYCQYEKEATIKMLAEDEFNDQIKELNQIISDPGMLHDEMNNYCQNVSKEIAMFIEPIQNKYINSAQSRNLFPMFLSKKFLIKLYNVVNCESLRDRLLFFLYERINYLSRDKK